MHRRRFLQITGGVLASLGTSRSQPRIPTEHLSEPLLTSGLQAMARAPGWFEAHWGAAMIAGSYLCAEVDLPDSTRTAIRAELDVLRRKKLLACRPFAFDDVQQDAAAALRTSLLPAMEGGLRHHGHAVIYTSLATRALKEHPDLAIPAIVKPICGWNKEMSRVSAKSAPKDAAPYRDATELVEATFETLLRFEPLIGHPSIKRPNFTHMVTHTAALRRFYHEGHREIWEAGWRGHRRHLAEDVPRVDSDDALDRRAVSLDAIRSEKYWKNSTRHGHWHHAWSRDDNPNGDWIAAGHLFKVLYAFHEIAADISDPDVVQRGARVVFERYFDPDVRGG